MPQAALRPAALLAFTLVTACLGAFPAAATELIYTPVNPVFGGNPLNGPVLLNNAQAQNNKKDPDAALRAEVVAAAVQRDLAALHPEPAGFGGFRSTGGQ